VLEIAEAGGRAAVRADLAAPGEQHREPGAIGRGPARADRPAGALDDEQVLDRGAGPAVRGLELGERAARGEIARVRRDAEAQLGAGALGAEAGDQALD
jgi:hypothetical protein